LFAVLTIQVYLYYQAFPADKMATKALVYTVFIIESVEVVLAIRDAFGTFGYGFGELSALTAVRSAWLLPIFSGILIILYSSGHMYSLLKMPPAIFWISQIHQVPAEMGDFDKNEQSVYYAYQLNVHSPTFLQIWLSVSAFTDVVIAAFMTFYLHSYDPQFRQTRVVVSKLVRLIIETGSLTAFMAVTALILFVAFPGRVYYAPSIAIMPLLYANTILVVLNSRFNI
ncbi:hypothetical protein FB45DRAFT_684036, partial [Roridomyces roridus]